MTLMTLPLTLPSQSNTPRIKGGMRYPDRPAKRVVPVVSAPATTSTFTVSGRDLTPPIVWREGGTGGVPYRIVGYVGRELETLLHFPDDATREGVQIIVDAMTALSKRAFDEGYDSGIEEGWEMAEEWSMTGRNAVDSEQNA